MRDFVYIAPSFTREESENAILSIRLTAGGHCFSVKRDNEIQMLLSKDIYADTYQEQIDYLFDSLERYHLTGGRFPQVNLYYANSYKLLIPIVEVNAGRSAIWLKTLGDAPQDEELVSWTVDVCKGEFFSSIPSKFERLKSLGEVVSIQNIATRFLTNSIQSVSVNHRSHWLFVEYSRGVVDIAVTKGQKLIFYNNYQVKQSEEVLYYVMQVMNLHGLGDKSNAVFSGDTTCGDDMIFATLRRYVPSFVMAANVVLKNLCNDSNIEVMPKFVHL